MHQEPFRRFRWPFAAMAVAAIVALSSLGALADSEAILPEPPPMKVQAVMPGAWYVQGLPELGSSANQNFISNAEFVITADGVVVIVTHYYADHIYGLQIFKDAGARIIAHRAALEYLNSDNARIRLETSRQGMAPWVNEQTRLVTAAEWLDGEKTVVHGRSGVSKSHSVRRPCRQRTLGQGTRYPVGL